MNTKTIFVIFLSIFFTNSFGAFEISNSLLLLLLAPFVFLNFGKKLLFSREIFLLLLALFLSIISCYYFRGQEMILTFKALAPFFYILFYFMLRHINLSIYRTERAIFAIVLLFCVSYIIQFLIYPTVIFSGAKEIYEDEVRIRMVAQGFSSLGYFFGLNKFFENKKNKFHFLLAILCFIVIFLMGFRTMLFMLILFSFFLLIQLKGFSWKIIFNSFLIGAIIISLSFLPIFSTKIDNMLSRQKSEVMSNSDYVRVLQLEYFTQEHFENIGEVVFGSGMPSIGSETSTYGKYMESLTEIGINWVDFGLLSISWIIGIPAVIIMLIYAIKAFKLKVANEYKYLGIWFLYLISISFTTMEFYRSGNFIVQALALFLVEKAHSQYINQKA